MESKTKYRILGIVVVIAIVVIMMPFVHLRQGNKPEALISPPPFPSQQVNSQQTAVEPSTTQNESFENPAIQQASNDDMINAVKPSIVNDTSDVSPTDPAPPAIQNPVSAAPISVNPPEEIIPTSSPKPKKHASLSRPTKVKALKTNMKPHTTGHLVRKQLVTASHKVKYPVTHITIQNNGLYDLQKPVWVIQLGSYHSKETAIRMVNSLRANGYKAFFQEIDTVLGEKTNVFVGPEIQQAAARHLAKQLQAELKVHGTVVSYKPFSL